MMERKQLSQARLQAVLHYEPETGDFTWKGSRMTPLNGTKAGSFSGHDRKNGGVGYVQIRVDRKLHFAHRLAFLYVTGEWPANHVDHINGVKNDNRWANLRDVPRSLNLQNQRRAKAGNKVGLLGVSVDRRKFVARIVTDGQQVILGRYETPEEAHEAYLQAKRELHEGCAI